MSSRLRRLTALPGLEPAFEDLSRGVLPDPNPDDCHMAPTPRVLGERSHRMFKTVCSGRRNFRASFP